ncbi:copper amine oxidase domain protein [Peptoniphilus duerdenii ATCC BAA-1640]|uniref:Copper amine oxidase domain protein n=1 Tax=Peptoniphilus duerdenii ATCC BAA-1640 TaxID=862517 RepID=E0NKC5_9FIRM|nr:stalk domain-containing protein [Peptoniphilus duerdenii]EFM25732.1 copper amine oxidase domain protein [Peptoniphilus duerdenii ATCC BAA-1640]
MNKKNFFAALVAALIFFNVILSENVLAYDGPKLDKDGYYTLTNGDYSISDREYDLVRLVKQPNGTYRYYKYGETVSLQTLSLDRGSCLNSRNKPKKIIIPEGVEAIMYGSFENMELTDVKFPKSLQYIGSSAFQGNEISGKISLPNVWKVDSYAFENNKITGIDAPKLELIDTNAFENNMIEGEVKLPELKAISWNGLANNNNEITLIAPKLEVVGRDAFLNTTVTKAELPKLKLVEGQGGQDNIKNYYTTKQFTVEWKAEDEAKLPKQKPEVKVHLYANGEQKENYVIVSNGAETAEFKDLPSYYIGQKPFNYTAKEEFGGSIIDEDETFEYELDGVKYTFKVKYEDDKIINTFVKSEDPKREEAKKALDAYMNSFNEDVVDNPAIEYQDEKVKGEIKKAITRAKDLLAKEDISQAELEEMEKIPYKKVDGKKSGLFRDFTKKALVNYEVLGDKNIVNPHNGKKYTALKNNTIKIKSTLKDAGKIGENDNFFFKLNYVKEEDFKSIPQPTSVDATSTPTPKYKKQEVPSADYEVNAVEGGYEIKINKLPEGAKIIKPIVYAKLADNTYFENGTLVFVSPKEDPAIPGGESHDRPSADDDSHRRYMPSYPFFFAYGGSKETKPATETKVPVEIKMDSKLVIGSKKLVVTVNGVQKEVVMDVEPFISNNRTMLPIRFVAEALGFKVEWDDPTRTVILTDKDTVVKIPVDTNQIIVNGKVFESDVKPILKNNRTMLPIANIARALGLVDGKDIIWDGATKEVTIKRETSK